MREFLTSGQVGNIELNAQKKIREDIQNRWESLGFVEGLQGNIKENIGITLTGKDLVIAFNARYFMEAFRVNEDEFVKVNFNAPTAPCIITPTDREEFLYLILPVRMIN